MPTFNFLIPGATGDPTKQALSGGPYRSPIVSQIMNNPSMETSLPFFEPSMNTTRSQRREIKQDAKWKAEAFDYLNRKEKGEKTVPNYVHLDWRGFEEGLAQNAPEILSVVDEYNASKQAVQANPFSQTEGMDIANALRDRSQVNTGLVMNEGAELGNVLRTGEERIRPKTPLTNNFYVPPQLDIPEKTTPMELEIPATTPVTSVQSQVKVPQKKFEKAFKYDSEKVGRSDSKTTQRATSKIPVVKRGTVGKKSSSEGIYESGGVKYYFDKNGKMIIYN